MDLGCVFVCLFYFGEFCVDRRGVGRSILSLRRGGNVVRYFRVGGGRVYLRFCFFCFVVLIDSCFFIVVVLGIFLGCMRVGRVR